MLVLAEGPGKKTKCNEKKRDNGLNKALRFGILVFQPGTPAVRSHVDVGGITCINEMSCGLPVLQRDVASNKSKEIFNFQCLDTRVNQSGSSYTEGGTWGRVCSSTYPSMIAARMEGKWRKSKYLHVFNDPMFLVTETQK